jgi:hypothetical protein
MTDNVMKIKNQLGTQTMRKPMMDKLMEALEREGDKQARRYDAATKQRTRRPESDEQDRVRRAYSREALGSQTPPAALNYEHETDL